MDKNEYPMIQSGLASAFLAFATGSVISILLSVKEPIFPYNSPGVYGISDTTEDLAWIIALLLLFSLIWLVASRARFFILGFAILGGEAGFHFFDLVNIRVPLPNGKSILVEVGRNTDWRVHLALVIAGVFCVWLDHKRRPA